MLNIQGYIREYVGIFRNAKDSGSFRVRVCGLYRDRYRLGFRWV